MKKHYIILSLVLVGLLSGCGSQSSNVHNDISITKSEQFDGYYKTDNYKMHLRDVRRSSGMLSMPSTGNQELLVVPVEILNTPFTPSMLSTLNKAFFGASEDTEWESVSSFYRKSSYGKLQLTGMVSDVLTFDKSSVWFSTHSDSFEDELINTFNRSPLASLKTNYDKDHDGYVDGICFIYSAPFSLQDGSPFWAWCNWTTTKANLTNPAINVHMWASYHFLSDGYGVGKIDAHTYIHETGHMLGLDDYYPYDNNFFAAGCLDMQDNNILDQNVYSKMALEWIYPYVVEDATTINLRPFESSGDCIIINDDWNGSALDEYIAIEFYTPTGLNQKDAANKYPGNDLQGFTIPGIKIYHIDSRVARISYLNKFMNYTNYVSDYSDGIYAVSAANSNDWSYTDLKAGTYKLVHLMEAGGVNTFRFGRVATNATLFQQNASFRPTSAFFPKDTKFNNDKEVGYQITIQDLSAGNATIKIDRI